MDNQNKDSNNYFIYFAVLAVNLITFTAGGSLSWGSPILPKLSNPDLTINPLPKPITTFEESWIAAIMNLGAVFGPLVGGLCSGRIGKKRTLLLLGVPLAISHLLCAFATNIQFFLVARFVMGIVLGSVFTVIPGYVTDIAEVKNRGALGSILGIYNCAGILFMYLIGPFLSVRIFSLINIIPTILFYATFGLCVPESPYDLLKRGNRKAAEESLMKLRNKTSVQIEKEFTLIIKAFEQNNGSYCNAFFTIFKSKALIKGLLISNGLMFFQQFSGISAVMGYTQSIFDSTGSSIPSTYSAMLVGVIQLVANIISSQFIDRAGRKILLIVSHIFLIISLITLGVYFFLKFSDKNIDQISWLPIASLLIYVIALNLGLANVPWVFLAEVFPANIKALTSTITTFFLYFMSFLTTMCFPYISAAIGMAGAFWIFAGILMAGLVFSVCLVPETKGKSNQEIQGMLSGIPK